LQKEFTVQDLSGDNPKRYTYVQYNGIDDYLHQAASSEWWPEGITYDPDNSGTPIDSLGVHEHWNDTAEMKYTRDLGTGDGIELIKLFGSHQTAITGIKADKDFASIIADRRSGLLIAKLSLEQQADIQIELFDINGRNLGMIYNGRLVTGEHNLDLSAEMTRIQTKQLYFFRVTSRSSARLYSETITIAL
jgi:hypothetical protein